MMDPLVTIVIPVYNAEKTIERCLDSVFSQSDQRFVVICIDDGSKDNSFAVLQAYRDQLPNQEMILLLSQDNAGVSTTRNKGISLAKTPYLMFLDNDDFLDFDYVETHLKKIEQTGADLVLSGYRRVSDIKTISTDSPYGSDWAPYRIVAPWARIYSRELLVDNKIKFPSINFGEDTLFNMQCYQVAKRIESINYVGYNWYFNENSVSNNIQKGLDPVCQVNTFFHKADLLFRKEEDPLLGYFIFRYAVWYLLYSGRTANTDRFIDVYQELFFWLEKNGYMRVYCRRPLASKQDSLKVRTFISIFYKLHKINLVKVFARIYCQHKT